MSSVNLIKHPMAGNCLKILRSKDTKTEEFRRAMDKLGLLLAMEATCDLETVTDSVITPLEVEAHCSFVNDCRILLIPILRAGLGFVESFTRILSSAKVAHIGIARDHDTLEAKPYLNTVPDDPDEFDRVLVLDPMLATGNSSVKALEMVINKGYSPDKITFCCALSTKVGIDQLQQKYPALKIVTAAIDPQLNDKAYIVPGLGDAGDRLNLL
ncbi:MAG TPA: uracil phosphoribosyltransferase [Syntrophomonas sp.]|jgi:uracil phosphoribosyltransferase|nr:uracil phosphoribosyltransferase [Syntrophomonas sp.]HCF70430.1 uracil phosphoribosyltransferase [Syntrophomonas sp.]